MSPPCARGQSPLLCGARKRRMLGCTWSRISGFRGRERDFLLWEHSWGCWGLHFPEVSSQDFRQLENRVRSKAPPSCPLLPAGCFPFWFSHLHPSGWCWALSLWREIVKMASAPHRTHWVFLGGRQSLTQKKLCSLSYPLSAFQQVGFPFWMLPLAAVSQEPQEWTVSVWNHPASPCPVTVVWLSLWSFSPTSPWHHNV